MGLTKGGILPKSTLPDEAPQRTSVLVYGLWKSAPRGRFYLYGTKAGVVNIVVGQRVVVVTKRHTIRRVATIYGASQSACSSRVPR